MHIDCFVIPVPEGKKEAYLEMAQWFDQAMIDLGALEVTECWEKDVPEGKRTDYRKAVQAEPGEKILVSWLIWPDAETAERAHDAIHDDERFKSMSNIPFDGKRMIFGSFEPLLRLQQP